MKLLLLTILIILFVIFVFLPISALLILGKVNWKNLKSIYKLLFKEI